MTWMGICARIATVLGFVWLCLSNEDSAVSTSIQVSAITIVMMLLAMEESICSRLNDIRRKD